MKHTRYSQILRKKHSMTSLEQLISMLVELVRDIVLRILETLEISLNPSLAADLEAAKEEEPDQGVVRILNIEWISLLRKLYLVWKKIFTLQELKTVMFVMEAVLKKERPKKLVRPVMVKEQLGFRG